MLAAGAMGARVGERGEGGESGGDPRLGIAATKKKIKIAKHCRRVVCNGAAAV